MNNPFRYERMLAVPRYSGIMLCRKSTSVKLKIEIGIENQDRDETKYCKIVCREECSKRLLRRLLNRAKTFLVPCRD